MASAGTGKMTVNPDIAKERRNASFHVENLTNFIYHGPERVRRRRYMQNIALQDPVIKDSKPWAFRTREEEYELSLRKQLHVLQRQKDLGITDEFDKFYYNEATAPNENNPVGLHFGMFIPTIEKHGTEEQKKKFVQPAKDLKIIGTYVQTELGHGTFIRGLETTATFDPKTQEFIVDTPTLSATKYWPGNCKWIYRTYRILIISRLSLYLFKCAMMVQKGQRLPDLVSYLSMDLSAKSCMTSDVALGCLVKAYQHRAARLTNAATAAVQRHMNEGQKVTDAFNMASTQLTWAARAHCH
ncbi:peroxisomal acyl-coenzyme A oxidase 1-like, partial [Mizuhopecten yessoensis]|uniref:peroxisomal acyl-coenzyme A oxidase 1-like n=1 Tax=Mizuhopecten yessoensis TaxID=6573 RepID=UPI000B45E465